MLTLDQLSALEVLERVDEYSLYCFYLDFEPVIGQRYRSRLRPGDDRPSFGIYERKYGGDKPHEYMWKDQGLPAPNYGDIFDLVLRLYPDLGSRLEALIKVATDFGLFEGTCEVERRLVVTPVKKETCRIRVKSREFSAKELQYWEQYNISRDLLDLYQVKAVQYFFLYDSDQYPRYPRSSMYSYQIFDRYQLYQPKPKEFYMDWTDTCYPGLAQLSEQRELLVVTKSMKDVICLRSFGIEAVAPRAENMIPAPEFIEWLKTFKKVFILMDNDGKSSPHLYPFLSVQVPKKSGQKDITDYLAAYGVEATRTLLHTLLGV